MVSCDLGPQYDLDDPFKAAARLHQSRYRSAKLKAGCAEYGNRLTDPDARTLLNYYGGMNVRAERERRFSGYSRRRDADMLRSEHIPFNLFAPLLTDPGLAERVLVGAFGVSVGSLIKTRIEWAPSPKEHYLDDGTSFDTYIEGSDQRGKRIGLGVEVKYTEQGYRIGETEKTRVEDKESPYWSVTRGSGRFRDDEAATLADDDIRQMWRNHLLGLAMCQRGELDEFVSAVLYPEGNTHMSAAVEKYRKHLREEAKSGFIGCTYEHYIGSINGSDEVQNWKQYLAERYLVE